MSLSSILTFLTEDRRIVNHFLKMKESMLTNLKRSKVFFFGSKFAHI